jgi:hypothetical protein
MDMKNGFWYSYDDIPAGGTSKARPQPGMDFIMDSPGHAGTGECARLQGEVTTAFQFGFIGMGRYLSPADVRESFDLSKKFGVKFWCKGDGRQYRIKLVSTHPGFVNKDSDNHFGHDFTAEEKWYEIKLSFNQLFQQPGWGSKAGLKKAITGIKEIQFVTLGQPIPSVDLWIDGLEIW